MNVLLRGATRIEYTLEYRTFQATQTFCLISSLFLRIVKKRLNMMKIVIEMLDEIGKGLFES